ncbi:MAG: ATP phosphoribosyltransferase [Vampirovibrionales bacterium]
MMMLSAVTPVPSSALTTPQEAHHTLTAPLSDHAHPLLRMTLPKGRIQENVLKLLERIGFTFKLGPRSYRPQVNDARLQAKVLKPQNIPSLIALGRYDCGFSGHDWAEELRIADPALGEDLVEYFDLGFDPVRIVVASPEQFLALHHGQLPTTQRLVVATEYPQLTQRYVAEKQLDAHVVRSYGATEALPPEDADVIVDNTSTGTTLVQNRLTIVDTVLRSTTRFMVHKAALAHPEKREFIDELVLLMKSAKEADRRVLLEMNVPLESFDALVKTLPCMKSPTVSPLFGDEGFAVKVAVPKSEVSKLIPQLVRLGAQDILEYQLEKLVPNA